MEDKIYTEDEAYELNRNQQEDVLNFRKVEFNKKDKEEALVKLIIKSNPKEKKPKKEKEEEVEVITRELAFFRQFDKTITYDDIESKGAGLSGKDYYCLKLKKGVTINGR